MKNQNRVSQKVSQKTTSVHSRKTAPSRVYKPELEAGALCILGELIEKATELRFECAVATLDCIADLVQHHPALQKEVASIRQMFKCRDLLFNLANAAANQ